MPDLVCYCFHVEKKTLVKAIEEGCRTVEDLHEKTGACGGCGGCRWDLEALLRFYQPENTRTTDLPN